MEIKEGMYVRTKFGIKQIYEIDEHKTKWKYLYKLKRQDGDGSVDLGVLSEQDIVKANYNIIDLIEVGDYVNGYRVEDFDDDYYDGELDDYAEEKSVVLGNEEGMYRIPVKDIKTIVTKEQFSQMEYMLGG